MEKLIQFQRMRDQGSYIESQLFFLQVYLSNLKMEIRKLNRKRKQAL